MILDEAHEFMDRTTQAVTEELTSGRVQRAAAMARKHMPGKLSDAFTKAADNFHDAMADYGDSVKGDFAALGRLEEIPSILDYEKHIKAESMYNTPAVFAVYTCLLTLQWLKNQGGIPTIEKICMKAATERGICLDRIQYVAHL